jgi:hypothetical protein
VKSECVFASSDGDGDRFQRLAVPERGGDELVLTRAVAQGSWPGYSGDLASATYGVLAAA